VARRVSTPDREVTAAEADRIYRVEVRTFLFDTAAPATEPRLVLLGGQPGAGKSRATRAIEQRRSRGMPCGRSCRATRS
jgi:UDP-N-acetylglucosamine kinase